MELVGSDRDIMPIYAEVAVQLPVHGTFHYQVPEHLSAHLAGRELAGMRVLVPFGNRGVTGVVLGTSERAPAGVDRVKPIQSLLDAEPAVSQELMGLCLWIADYYEAPPGEVLRIALPAGTRVSSHMRVELTSRGRDTLANGGAMSRRHRDILGALAAADGPLPQSELVRSKKARVADIEALVAVGLVRLVQAVDQARVRPRTERTAVLARALTDDDRAALARSPKKLAALEALEAAGGAAAVARLKPTMPNVSTHLRGLAKRGLVRFENREAQPLVAGAGAEALHVHAPQSPPPLNERQRAALASIRAGLRQERFHAYLLHGITGSGKTEVYLNAIADVLDAGKSAVVLVPEISLTPQLAARFRARFGDQVAILHSGLKSRERFDEWQRLKSGSARIALGARSAVFAPVSNLGMVVVDEEHDGSFKQEEGVRYNGRDVALVRAQRAGAVCVLGSATPSLESFHAARAGRYTLLRLPDRATAGTLPEVEVVDLRVYRPESEAMLTAPLSEAIAATLDQGDQVILFLNRRGFDTFVLCRACGQAFRCTYCSVSLTYHRRRDRLLCHYCGFSQRVPADCPACQAEGAIVRKGMGTEKVADAVAERFPGARVARLDRDTATGTRMAAILRQVARREVDILVGTQMVTKGHDFPGVTLVGVLWADTGLSLPDFRASERTFQLLTQVAGRAGRGDRPGRVVIQAYRPDAVAITSAACHDYDRFYQAEAEGRRELGYPPFGHLIALRIDGPDPRAVQTTARALAERGQAILARLPRAADTPTSPASPAPPASILGPTEAPLARIKGRTRWHMWLRAPDRKVVRSMVRQMIHQVVRTEPGPAPGVRVTVDVDPLSSL